MNRIARILPVVLLIIGFGVAALGAPPWVPPTEAEVAAALDGLGFDDFVEESYRLYLLRYPESVAAMGLADELGIRNDGLNNYSAGYIQETLAIEAEILERFWCFDLNALTDQQQTTWRVCAWYWDDAVRWHPYINVDYPVNFLGSASPHGLTKSTLSDWHPFASEDDIVDYLTRLEGVGPQFDQIIKRLEQAKELGIVAPRLVLEWSIPDIQKMMSTPVEKHLFYTTLATKGALVPDLPPVVFDQYLQFAAEAIESVVKPAYRRLYDAVVRLLPDAPDKISIGQYRGGDAAYAALLRHYTQTDLTPNEIHTIGLREVARLQGEIRAAAAALGITRTTTMTGIFNVASAQQGTEQGSRVVTETQDLIDQAKERIVASNVFRRLPEASVVVVGAEHGEYYTPPAIDGSFPGVYYVTTSRERAVYKLPTVAYHETYPGHHLQIGLAQELDLPLLRRDVSFTAFAEGWALYAERLMSELGAYKENRYGNLGRLQDELLRAVRLVVDTGIHDKGWTFATAVQYVMVNHGVGEFDAAQAVLRYAVLPGQATAYMLGMLEVLDLRARAEAALGEAFDLAEFHDVLLRNGSVPLPLLRLLVEDWLAETSSVPAAP